MMSDELRAALSYAERGWAVIPLHAPFGDGRCSCRKAQCSSIGKHPRMKNWRAEATTDPETIQHWFTGETPSNVGIVTGKRSGLVVLDVDDKNQGSLSLAQLVIEHGPTATLTVRTGGGRHLYFKHPMGVEIPNRVGTIADGLDVRGDGGLVVAPPSMHASRARYEWLDEYPRLAELPSWLLRMIMKDVASHSECSKAIPRGKRNDSLFRQASSLRGRGADANEITRELQEINNAQCVPPLSANEVGLIASSAAKYARGNLALKLQGLQLGQPVDSNPLHSIFLNVPELFGSRSFQMARDYQRGWMICLLLEAWRGRGVLPIDPEVLRALARVTSVELWEREKQVILSEFTETTLNGERVLFHERIAAQYAQKAAVYRKQIFAAAAGAEARSKGDICDRDASGDPGASPDG